MEALLEVSYTVSFCTLSCLSLSVCLSLSLHHVHGVLGEEGMDVGEGGPQLAVSVPAAQHQLIQALRAHGRLGQIHLRERGRTHRQVIHYATLLLQR